jgi:hypothetical protein
MLTLDYLCHLPFAVPVSYLLFCIALLIIAIMVLFLHAPFA